MQIINETYQRTVTVTVTVTYALVNNRLKTALQFLDYSFKWLGRVGSRVTRQLQNVGRVGSGR